MCRALAADGIDAQIATTDADGPDRLDVPLGEWMTWNGVRTIFFRNAFSESFKYSPTLAAWLSDHVHEVDVVHIHGVLSHACFAAASACRHHRVPYIVRPLGTLAPWSLQQKAAKKRLILSFGGMRMLRAASAIHYTSSREKRDVETRFGFTGGVVVPLGIDQTLLESPGTRNVHRDRFVVAISRIHPKKNLDILIAAFLDASSGFENWTLIVAGTGEPAYVESLKKLIAERHGNQRVQFVGWLDHEAKTELLRRASLFALCSKHENFGLAALEAMASGVPVLLTREVDLADDVENAKAGWIVDGTAGQVEGALAAAMRESSERQSKASAARLLAERFAWPAIASQLSAVYGSVAEHAAPGHRELLTHRATT